MTRSGGFDIEFLGLPGSGKSTLANGLVHQNDPQLGQIMTVRTAGRRALKKRIKASTTPWTRLPAYALGAALLRNIYPVTKYEIGAYNRFCLMHPDLTWTAHQTIAQAHSDAERRDKVAKLWFKHCARYQLVTEAKYADRAILAPEGFLQRAATLHSGSETQDPHMLRQYLDHTPLPRIMVHLDTDPVTAAERMAKRPRKAPYPLGCLAEPEIRATLRGWRATHLKIVELAQSSGVYVLTVTPDDTEAAALERLRTQLIAVRKGSQNHEDAMTFTLSH